MNNVSNVHLGLLIHRVTLSIFMMTHGWPKFLRLFEAEIRFGDPIGIGVLPSLILVVIGELVAPLCIVIGFKVRWASAFPIATMVVAAFVAHADDPFATKEKALLFLLGFVLIAICGSGKYALDNRLGKKI